MPRRMRRRIRKWVAWNVRELGLRGIALVVFLALVIGVLVPWAMQYMTEAPLQRFAPSDAPPN